MQCPKCQTENIEGAKFCKTCGQPLHTERLCPQCGHVNSPDSGFCIECGHSLTEPAREPASTPPPPRSPEPTSFADGRYQVKKLLGEGGKKRVYLAHDTRLDRDVAFALIKTEGLDEEARSRITREAQAMGRLGDHPSIVAVYDFGEHEGQPYLVLPLMSGGDVEGLIGKAPEHRLPLEQTVSITRSVCQGLEFAHSNGIIHRDLKPGNVYLAADGTAKIGDFGLAVTVDVSRLTKEGMMVGTASYMPPEQAMAKEVTPRSDLYSVGAMLYEMVTGRPPFVGDTSVAIITQHIDTSPPISPTWHRKDIPPGLEVLIMQLLEKDPEKRPASAADVLKILETIDLQNISRTLTEEAPTIDRGPLYRRTFVGRDTELKLLQSAFDGAASGQGALMMVVGEPGIGKTAICEQLTTYATIRGGKCLTGHCYEEGSLSLPYLAFVEAMRSYVLDRSTRDLRKELGTGAADVARIVSEVREKLKVEPRLPESPEEERYRLMQAVTGFLANAARVQPLLIILEDLHDADKGTLEMLTHVSRNLGGARLLIVGTYRDVEVDRTHPLSASLAELRRVARFDRIRLRGLNPDEVQRMVSAITGMETTWSFAEAVHRQTEGNPLFVQEVLRYLKEGGIFTGDYGSWQQATQTPIEMAIPEGLRDVIGRRLSLLSEECNRILSVASVIGREFRLDVLQKVTDAPEDELFAALEEAKGAAVVEERSAMGAAVTYHFAHAFFKQTLYEEIIAPRRIRLHQQVAQVMEKVYTKRLEDHATELAEHFSYSPELGDLAKAVSYGAMAAQRAAAVYAWGEAIRLLEQAIKVQDVLDADDKEKRCDLLGFLGDVLSASGQPRRALDVELPEAFSLAEAIGDSRRASLICRRARGALTSYWTSLPRDQGTAEIAQWAERADRYAQPETVDRAWADMYLGLVSCLKGDAKKGIILLKQAIDLARRLGNPQTLWGVSPFWMSNAQAPQHQEEVLRLAKELGAQWRAGGIRVPDPYMALQYTGNTFLTWGQRQRAEEAWREHRNVSERRGNPVNLIVSMALDGVLATLDGRLEDSVEIANRIQARCDEMGLPEYAPNHVAMTAGRALSYLGRDEIPVRASDDPVKYFTDALRFAYLGQKAEAVEILKALVLQRPGFGSADDETPELADAVLLEAAVLVEYQEATELLLSRLAGSGMRISSFFPACIGRHLGAAAVMLGRPEDGRKYYQDALKVATGMRFRPEIAIIRLQFAELLLKHYPDEKTDALEHLDFAISEFREMKMQPALERALRHKEILGA
ncbi:MAG TPA: protein kinase [Dehalococcoidia bacterium]|nr:protein kinase [Dehalococcoidia bacterium]